MSRRAEISKNLVDVQERIQVAAKNAGRDLEDIHLIVVTKSFPVSDVEILKELGINDFGENRDSDAAAKAAMVAGTWHFQGQIQSNKLKSICSWAHVIHSLDDSRHFEIIKKFATHPLEIFLQVNLDGSENRGGASIQNLHQLAAEVQEDPVHSLMGIMAVAPLTSDAEKAFDQLHSIHAAFSSDFPSATMLSAGMSSDFELAIAYGATHLRIGSEIMGSR
jgi:pyridoxal phosphate enzyme (YggS family)